MAKPLRVWTGSEWVEVATQIFDTDLFLTTAVASATYLPISASFNPDGYLTEATASATYLPISASATLGGGGYSKSFLLGGM